jgi:hypothetical protein
MGYLFKISLIILKQILFTEIVCNYKCLLLFILVLGSSIELSAQEMDHKYTYSISGNVFKGFIYRHTVNIGHLITEHPTGFEVSAFKSTYGNRDWQSLYNYPDIGLSLIMIDYHNQSLGKTIASLIYNDLYLTSHNKSNHLKLRIGGGLGYHTNPYDPVENPRNSVVSTSISYALQMRLEYGIAIKEWKILSALTLNHYSNAAMRQPNMGINIPTFSLGLSRNLSNYKLNYTQPADAEILNKGINFNFNVGAGITSVPMFKDTKFLSLTFTGYADKRISKRSIVNAGLDLFVNYGLREQIKYDENTDDPPPDFKRVGILAGHEFYMDRVGILIQLGLYVYNPYGSDKAIYQRYGIKYYISKKIYTALYLKSHAAVAEVAEYTIGVRL